MGNVAADNSNLPPRLLVWKPSGADTEVVWSYDCAVDSGHKVISSVNLASSAVCPRHHTALTGEKAVDVS